MSESLDSQIVVCTTEVFYPERRLSLKKLGRKRLLNREKYLEAVKKILSTSGTYVSRYLGVSRITVYRFKRDNPEVVSEAEEYLEEMSYLDLSHKLLFYENFIHIPTIQKYKEIMERRRVGKKKMNTKLRAMFHMCKYLNVHPQKTTPEQVAKVVVEMRERKIWGENVPRGLSYLTQREAWRGYFQSVKGISGHILTDLGMDAQPSLGSGSYSKQRLTREQRHSFEKSLKEFCMESNLTSNDYWELRTSARCMYYTGTRRKAMLRFNFESHRYELGKDFWILEVLDKGRNGGTKWEKIFLGYALEALKEYFVNRFKMDKRTLEEEISKKIRWLFPIYHDKLDSLSRIYRKVQKKAGIKTTIPVHIFRHTFAQDCLDATGWNYEMVASIGGWKSTYILKKHYGEMGRMPKIRELQKAMKILVKIETHELKW